MAEKSAIEWCDSTFNPWVGCTKISPACDHCYAEAQMDTRLGRVQWGAGQQRQRTSDANWRQPVRWNAQWFAECTICGWRGNQKTDPFCPSCHAAQLQPARRRVFCASLADVFDNEVPVEWRAALFRLIAATKELDWLLLTKRIGNAAEMMRAAVGVISTDVLLPEIPNVWIGATVCNQQEADRDIPKLLATPARVRFLSIEPMLGPVSLRTWQDCHIPEFGGDGRELTFPRGIHWVIAGGESGPHARPMHPDWVRSLRDQCAAARVPFLLKQIGKRAAGRTLDGVEHNGFPGVTP